MDWASVLEFLNSLLHLDRIIVWAPSAAAIATVTSIVYFLRRLLSFEIFKRWFDKVTDGKGVLFLVGLVAFLTDILPKLDNGLSWYELLLSFVTTSGASVAFWEFVKRIFPFLANAVKRE